MLHTEFRKTFSTVFALVRPFTRVYPLVSLELTCEAKFPRTAGATVRFVAKMFSLVTFKVEQMLEGFFALLALVRSLIKN